MIPIIILTAPFPALAKWPASFRQGIFGFRAKLVLECFYSESKYL